MWGGQGLCCFPRRPVLQKQGSRHDLLWRLVAFYLLCVSFAAVATYSPHVGNVGWTGLSWSSPLFTEPKEPKPMYSGPLHAFSSWASPGGHPLGMPCSVWDISLMLVGLCYLLWPDLWLLPLIRWRLHVLGFLSLLKAPLPTSSPRLATSVMIFRPSHKANKLDSFSPRTWLVPFSGASLGNLSGTRMVVSLSHLNSFFFLSQHFFFVHYWWPLHSSILISGSTFRPVSPTQI